MFAANPLRLGQHFFFGIAQNNFAVVLPRHARYISGIEAFQDVFDLGGQFFGYFFAVRNAHHWRVGPVFGLPQQINGNQLTINRIVANDHCFGWPRQQINAHAAKQLSFGFGHVGVAWANEHIHRRYGIVVGIGIGSQSHQSHGLNTAQNINFVGSCQVLSGHNGGGGFALVGWRTGNYVFHARHFCRQNTHVGRSQKRVFSAWHVSTHPIHRNIFMAQNHPRQRFHFHVAQAHHLDLGKTLDLGLGKLNIGNVLRRQTVYARLNFGGGEFKRRRIPLVKFGAVIPNGFPTSGFDVGQNGFYRFNHLLIDFFAFLGGFARFDVLYHC